MKKGNILQFSAIIPLLIGLYFILDPLVNNLLFYKFGLYRYSFGIEILWGIGVVLLVVAVILFVLGVKINRKYPRQSKSCSNCINYTT